MSIAKNIKKYRLALGLTQKQLAERMGVVPSLVTMYETEKRKPKPEMIVKFASALEIHPDKLLEGAYEDVFKDYRTTDGKIIADKFIAGGGVDSYIEFAKLTWDVKQIQDEHKLIAIFRKLNCTGQKVALDRIAELSEIPRYQADNPDISDILVNVPAGNKQDEPTPDDSSDGSPKDKV